MLVDNRATKIQSIPRLLKYVRFRESVLKYIILMLLWVVGVVSISCKEENLSLDHLVFRYNEHSNITSLDPAFAKDQRNIWACNQLFTGLTQLNDSLKVKPDIAKAWTISEDGLSYKFELRDDVYFHKSPLFGPDSLRSVSASDFVYSLNRLKDPKVASPGGWVLQEVQEIKAVDASTLLIRLKRPFPAFLGILSMKFCSVVPREVVEYYKSDFREHPIGTGPFQFKRWEENIKLVFRRNKYFYQKDHKGERLPYLEAVAITFLPDKQSELLQFIQGNLDFLNGLDPSYKDELLTSQGKLRSKYEETIELITAPYLNTEYLGINMSQKNSPLQSASIRKAINYGFDRKKMIAYLRNNMATPANNGFIPKGLPGFNNLEGFDYQPNLAKELLREYSTKLGARPQITLSTNGQYLDICEYIQRELELIGFEVAVDVMPPSTLRKQRSSGNLSIFRSSWIADYPDAQNYLSLFYSKNMPPNGPNYTRFQDDQYDAWYEAALQTTNDSLRIVYYQKMDSLIVQEAPIIPLYYDQAVRFTHKDLKGLGINPINMLDLRTVHKR